MIEYLFTPEVMERMFSVLETAAQGSVSVLIIYLTIPLLISLSITAGWCYAVYHVVKRIHDVLIAHFARPRPEIVKKEVINLVEFDGKPSELTASGLSALPSLIRVIRDRSQKHYVHGFDIKKAEKILIKHWEN